MNSAANTMEQLVASVLAAPTAVRIDGEPRSAGLARSELIAPADGAVWTDVAVGGTAEATEAVAAAARTLPRWSAYEPARRGEALRAVADDLDAAAGQQAWPGLITRETGKRLAESKAELGLSAVYFRVFADLIEKQESVRFDAVPGHSHVVEAGPAGVVAVLTPWNFPVSIPARKIAPALAAGCSVTFKPSELAPMSSMVLAALIDRHVPGGVVDTVLGDPADVVDPWLEHPDVRAVSFTGSTRVGRLVAAGAAANFQRTVLELGGCAPFVVLADADPEAAARTLMVAKYRNNGQSCIAANQILVARPVADAFVEAFAAASRELTVGDPLDETTGLGPMAPAGDPARLRNLVQAAVADGARVVVDSADLPPAGHFAAPTVLTDVSPDSAVFRDEIFGPVAAIRTFDDVDEALAHHHDTGYGLAGYVCGTDLDAARAVGRRLRAGIVGVNTGTPNYPGAPFGGTGLSGLGYEGGRQGLEEFQAFRTIAMGPGRLA
ncbi:succinate-semialdehyde dehydrogenase/glutarate-semialdehyde dehydrogenase [Haloactinopolyspora alba]|uniref:Succinate-semialdehyde dehydrogenase/glutarate-semialdehyde dehydrogenase n=1 Tax=Haloactinopolyspora alba TaxID=648780 RepID=A0A2P8E992_9ACTN|nr:aldehyde dehydrogenase family protein [Haloactinopolyspora alba]PSL06046.1 succinate-semialdehyde dehydrogenase/glutarate-semialdehyde dehydrogenase [Haloactinopolyspora alba]